MNFMETDVSPEDYAKVYESDADWTSRITGVDLINQAGSFEAASIVASLGTDLQAAADMIAQAAAVGISTDLEAAAAGAGFGSFADAVAAYNAQYGTNYTPEEAAAALGN